MNRSSGSTLRRFVSPERDLERTYALDPGHAAITEGRTLFPTTVVPSAEAPRLFVSGHNNPKLGGTIQKGPRRGWPIYHLTLEERATCPRSCPVFDACFGNAMPFSRRHAHDDGLIPRLRREMFELAAKHPKGLLIRLHALGDFYSVAYVEFWRDALAWFPPVAVFGYTARRDDADDDESRAVARAIRELTESSWERFSIRFSRPVPGPQRAVVVDHDPQQRSVIVCPAQTGRTEACATCGLCWAPAAREKTIAFLRHGMKRSTGPRQPRQRATEIEDSFWTAERLAVLIPDWIAGGSGAVIAKKIGAGCTRNAVIGKVNRLGLARQQLFRTPSVMESPITPALVRLAEHDLLARRALERKRQYFSEHA